MKPNSTCLLCGAPAFELASTQECGTADCKNYSQEFWEAQNPFTVEVLDELVEVFRGDNEPQPQLAPLDSYICSGYIPTLNPNDPLYKLSSAAEQAAAAVDDLSDALSKFDGIQEVELGDLVAHREVPDQIIGTCCGFELIDGERHCIVSFGVMPEQSPEAIREGDLVIANPAGEVSVPEDDLVPLGEYMDRHLEAERLLWHEPGCPFRRPGAKREECNCAATPGR